MLPLFTKSHAHLNDGNVEKQEPGLDDYFRSHGGTSSPSPEEREGTDGAADGAGGVAPRPSAAWYFEYAGHRDRHKPAEEYTAAWLK